MFTEEENLVRVELHVLDVKVSLSNVDPWSWLEQLNSDNIDGSQHTGKKKTDICRASKITYCEKIKKNKSIQFHSRYSSTH